jgi:hypothetical protein
LCGTPFSQKRPNEYFCSSKCFDGWRYLHKKKDQIAKRREARYQAMSPCALCGVDYQTILTAKCLGSRMHQQKFVKDHILPRSHDGDDSPDNLRNLCWFCNTARRDISSDYDKAIAAAGKAFWDEIRKLATGTSVPVIPSDGIAIC